MPEAEVKEEKPKVEKKKELELSSPDYHVYDQRSPSHSFCLRCRRHVRDPQSHRELPAYKKGTCPE